MYVGMYGPKSGRPVFEAYSPGCEYCLDVHTATFWLSQAAISKLFTPCVPPRCQNTHGFYIVWADVSMCMCPYKAVFYFCGRLGMSYIVYIHIDTAQASRKKNVRLIDDLKTSNMYIYCTPDPIA